MINESVPGPNDVCEIDGEPISEVSFIKNKFLNLFLQIGDTYR